MKKFLNKAKPDMTDVEKNSDMKKVKNDIFAFYKVGCKDCVKKLNKFLVKLMMKRKEELIDDFIENKLCEKCKKHIK